MSYTQIFRNSDPHYAKPITLGAAKRGFSTAIRRTQGKQPTHILLLSLYRPDFLYAGSRAEIRISWGDSGIQNITVWVYHEGKEQSATMKDRGDLDEGIYKALWAVGFDCEGAKNHLRGEHGIKALAKWLLTHEPEGFVVFSKTHP